jgi:general secretion pathway protein G
MWHGKLSLIAPRHHCAKGFTLIELLLTLALLATLSTVAYPLTAMMGQRDRELELQRSLREIRRAIDSYKVAADDKRIEQSISASGYPPNLQALVQGVTDKSDIKGQKIFFCVVSPATRCASAPNFHRLIPGNRAVTEAAPTIHPREKMYLTFHPAANGRV